MSEAIPTETEVLVAKTETGEIVAAAVVLVARDTRKRNKKMEDHGTRIAAQYKWTGEDILFVAEKALKDSNFPQEADILNQIRAALDANNNVKFELKIIEIEKVTENDPIPTSE